MKPYYDDGQIQIWHGDCREVVINLPDASVDVVLADPPYGETSLGWDARVAGWGNAMRGPLKLAGSLWCFGSMRFFLEERDEFSGWHFSQEIVWEKHNGSGFMTDRFRRVHELLTHWYRGSWSGVYRSAQFTADATKRTIRRKEKPPHFSQGGQWDGERADSRYVSIDGGPRLMRSVLQVRSCHGHALHPTQKPEGIVRPILSYSLPPGGVLLEPFMGSGTGLVIAREMGARAIGIDTQELWCETAAKRLQQSVLPFAAVEVEG